MAAGEKPFKYIFNLNDPDTGNDDNYILAWNVVEKLEWISKNKPESRSQCGNIFDLNYTIENNILTLNFKLDISYLGKYQIYLYDQNANTVFSELISKLFADSYTINIPIETGVFILLVQSDKCNTILLNETIENLQDDSVLIYYGTIYSLDINNIAPSELQYKKYITSGDNIEIDFRYNLGLNYLIVIEPVTEPLKTNWFGAINNEGNINDPSDFFSYIEGEAYRMYYSNYRSRQNQTTITLKQ